MPELPEVEHAARCLRRWLAGERVVRAEAEPTRVFRGSDRAAFERLLRGRRLERVERRGKQLLLRFDGDVAVSAHLGMSGKLVRRAPGEPAPPHDRARLVLARGDTIHYVDPRMFGRIAAGKARDLPSPFEGLGPDALDDGVDPAALRARFAKSDRAVKVALMDQSVVAGLGNIYATEVLFRAGVHPARPARSLRDAELFAIARAVHDTLASALRAMDGCEGDTEYLSDGAHVENPFAVYDRAGEPCPKCGTPIRAVVLGGRTSAYCPHCQPKRPRSGGKNRQDAKGAKRSQ